MANSIWVGNRVPDGFWLEPKNRKAYMRWLGKKLGFTKKTDWYNINKIAFHQNNGGGLLANIYNDSPQAAVREHFPTYDWKDWLFKSCRQGFWKDSKNRINYLKWLGKTLGYKTKEDWYKLDQKCLLENRGGALLHSVYKGSVIKAVRELYPKDDWIEWKFHCVPQGFWKSPKNRKRYLTWLGGELGFKKDWEWAYLTKRHLREQGGAGLLAEYYNDSPMKLLKWYLPKLNWKKLRTGARGLDAQEKVTKKTKKKKVTAKKTTKKKTAKKKVAKKTKKKAKKK